VRLDVAGVRLLTRNSIDWTTRFPLIAAAAAARVKYFLIDGEVVCCDANGMPVFDWLRYRRDDRHRTAAFGACACVAIRNGFHMSITARRMRALFRAPSQA
jgi:ATP-dependent DNA ligase